MPHSDEDDNDKNDRACTSASSIIWQSGQFLMQEQASPLHPIYLLHAFLMLLCLVSRVSSFQPPTGVSLLHFKYALLV